MNLKSSREKILKDVSNIIKDLSEDDEDHAPQDPMTNVEKQTGVRTGYFDDEAKGNSDSRECIICHQKFQYPDEYYKHIDDEYNSLKGLKSEYGISDSSSGEGEDAGGNNAPTPMHMLKDPSFYQTYSEPEENLFSKGEEPRGGVVSPSSESGYSHPSTLAPSHIYDKEPSMPSMDTQNYKRSPNPYGIRQTLYDSDIESIINELEGILKKLYKISDKQQKPRAKPQMQSRPQDSQSYGSFVNDTMVDKEKGTKLFQPTMEKTVMEEDNEYESPYHRRQICPWCDKIFDSWAELSDHFNRDHKHEEEEDDEFSEAIKRYEEEAKSGRKPNPWAVCRSMQNKYGWDDEKTERCIRKVKEKTG